MADALPKQIEEALTEYRRWVSDRDIKSGRLVQYTGVECTGALSVKLDEIEAQIEGLMSKAFCVEWNEHRRRVYLRVWESDGPEPAWPKVFAEENLADMEAIEREIEREVGSEE